MNQNFTETVTFVEHAQFEVNLKKGGSKTKNVFTDTTGREFQVWKQDVAAVIFATFGQPITVTGKAKPNGEWMNLDVEAAMPGVGTIDGGAPAPTTVVPPQATIAPQTATIAPPQASPAPAATSNGAVTGAQKDARITRAAALDRALTAFGIAGHDPIANQDELFELSELYAEYLRDGATVGAQVPVTATAAGPTV